MASTNTRLNPMRPGYTRPKAVSSLGRPPAGAASTEWRMPNRGTAAPRGSECLASAIASRPDQEWSRAKDSITSARDSPAAPKLSRRHAPRSSSASSSTTPAARTPDCGDWAAASASA